MVAHRNLNVLETYFVSVRNSYQKRCAVFNNQYPQRQLHNLYHYVNGLIRVSHSLVNHFDYAETIDYNNNHAISGISCTLLTYALRYLTRTHHGYLGVVRFYLAVHSLLRSYDKGIPTWQTLARQMFFNTPFHFLVSYKNDSMHPRLANAHCN